jgi:Bacterial SH3 domain
VSAPSRAGGPRAAALLAALVTALVTAAPLPAEPLYVIEQLVVGVSSTADASGERIATLKSGDRVEELERSGEQVHVRLASGRDGWVRASYLSTEEPLRVRLAQRDAEVARLGNQVSSLEAQLAARPAAGAAAAATPVALTAARSAAAPAAGALFDSEERPRALWPRLLAASLIAFGFGFALGALLLDRHIRRKYGGLRIY